MDDNKKKALAAALMQIEKQFGKGSVMRMGDVDTAKDIDVVSTGSLSLDIALGYSKPIAAGHSCTDHRKILLID